MDQNSHTINIKGGCERNIAWRATSQISHKSKDMQQTTKKRIKAMERTTIEFVCDLWCHIILFQPEFYMHDSNAPITSPM